MSPQPQPLPAFAKDVRTQYTETPNPAFTYGQTVDQTEEGRKWNEGQEAGWKVVETASEDPKDIFKLMISGIVPRPIALVSTVSEDGTENLAPFSWFNMVTHNPPLVSVSILSNPTGGLTDTTRNIKTVKKFTVNLLSEPFAENGNMASIDAPRSVSEWPLTGLTKEPSIHVKAPRVKESVFSMECELFHAHDIIDPFSGAHTTTLILGRVMTIHVRNDVLNERGVVDITKFRPVSRLGDISYARVGAAFRLEMPLWTEEGEKAQEFMKDI